MSTTNGVTYKWLCALVTGALICLGGILAKSAVADLNTVRGETVDLGQEVAEMRGAFKGVEKSLGKVQEELVVIREWMLAKE